MILKIIFIVLEYVGPKWRTFVANMCTAIYFGIGALVMPWIAYLVNDWKILTIVLSVPLLAAVATPWVVPESARYFLRILSTLPNLPKPRRFLQIILKS